MILAIFSCAYVPSVYLLWWGVCLDLLPVLNWVFLLLKSFLLEEFFVYFGYKFFIRYVFFKYFLTVCYLPFHSLEFYFKKPIVATIYAAASNPASISSKKDISIPDFLVLLSVGLNLGRGKESMY